MTIKYGFPYRRSPRSDPQRHRVYRMELEAIGARSYLQMTRATQRKMARAVCRAYKVPQVRLVVKPIGKWAALWSGMRIELNSRMGYSSDMITLTHELAHHIHYHLSDDVAEEQEDHGPQFMACHMSILDTCRVIPIEGMRAICAKWKIKYIDPGSKNHLGRLQKIAAGKIR